MNQLSVVNERPRLAALDVGSNSIRLVVVELEPDSGYRVLDEEREMTRLAAGLEQTGRLCAESIKRSLEVIGKMKAIADGFKVSAFRTIATSAVREAANGKEFCTEVKRHCGVHVHVITPAEEARFAFASATRHFALEGRSTAIVDIGGGSVEVVLAGGTVIERVHSLPLGAVRLTDRFSRSDPWNARDRAALKREVDRVIKEGIGKPLHQPDLMIGSGGTFTTLAEVVRCQREGHAGSVHGYIITRTEIVDLLRRLYETPLGARRHIAGLNPQRADIIVAGAAVVARLAKRLGIQQIQVNAQGIRDGLLADMISELSGGGAEPPARTQGRMAGVRALARKCRSHEAHCEHVAGLAGQIFDALREAFDLPPAAREILHAAALLHDIGYLIGHSRHHKHAYHLIMHSALPGFTPRDLELIANVARYHRRAFPKRAHANFARLAREDRTLVARLGGILRVADALDRTHMQRIKGVQVRRGQSATRVLIHADSDPQVELWYAHRKGDLFERAFATRLKFAVSTDGQGTRRARSKNGAASKPAPALAT